MIFNQSQIQEMLAILKRYESLFIAGQIGIDYLSPTEKNILSASGINLDDFKDQRGILEHAYLFGILSDAIGDVRAKKMNYTQFQKFLSSGAFIPLTKEEEFALKQVKNRAYNDITNLGSRMRTGLSNSVVRNNQQQAELVQKIIKQKTVSAIELRKGATELASDLANLSKDWEVDWLRIAYYLTHEAYNTGRAQNILNTHGGGVEVYFDVFPKACNRCKELYLEEPNNPDSKPKVFKLIDIIANGNNIGRKSIDWLPTVAPIHPYCRCIINYKKPGFDWDYKLRAFVKPVKIKSSKLENKKLNIKITKE